MKNKLSSISAVYERNITRIIDLRIKKIELSLKPVRTEKEEQFIIGISGEIKALNELNEELETIYEKENDINE